MSSLTEEDIDGLRETIADSVQRHFGGVKFAELVVDVLGAYFKSRLSCSRAPTPDDVEQVAAMDFGILRYSMEMGGMKREKLFVYSR